MNGNGLWAHPARLVPLGFIALIALGTLLLLLPAATSHGVSAPFLTAWFTATSAGCVTGLAVVDTPTYWSPFGQVVILALFQVGGLGIMTLATLLGLLVSRRLGLTSLLVAQSETHSLNLGDVKHVLKLVVMVTCAVEGLTAIWLAGRLHFGYGLAPADALWHGLFHSVSAFNNAGFSTYSDSLMGFAGDAWFLAPIALAVLVGGIGFPVLLELRQRRRARIGWSLHTRLTVAGSVLLLLAGTLAIAIAEWSNPATLGALGLYDKLLAASFASVMPRTAGFNALDISALRSETLGIHYLLMFIGGGSAGTAGGVKIATVAVLWIAVLAEIRGENDSAALGRRIPPATLRQAMAVIGLSLGIVVCGSFTLLALSDFALEDILFETISAFATVGLSTGITAQLPAAGQMVLIVLMFIGRVGSITIATALALRSTRTRHRYPEERPIIG